MWIVTIGSFVGPLILIIPNEGFQIGDLSPAQWSVHKVFGLIILCLVGIQSLGGIFCRWQQELIKNSAKGLMVSKMAHRILGNLLMILAKVAVLIGWFNFNQTIFIVVIILECLILLLRILFYFLYPSFETQPHDPLISNP